MSTAPPPALVVGRATPDDLDALTRLFDAYRVFYRQASDPALARAFLHERLQRAESVIFIARGASGDAVGFTQLYPSFSSVSARRTWILNDLFVVRDARRRGVARALMERARAFASETGALRLMLETAEDNHPGRSLYESLGYLHDAGTRHYILALEQDP